ncbi:hypothetical protein U1Q18_018100 [Sarracenia purpurea var. burkii]
MLFLIGSNLTLDAPQGHRPHLMRVLPHPLNNHPKMLPLICVYHLIKPKTLWKPLLLHFLKLKFLPLKKVKIMLRIQLTKSLFPDFVHDFV